MAADNIITKARFSLGLSYEQYLETMTDMRPRFEEQAAAFRLSAEDKKAFSDLNKKLGGLKVLAIAEDWCPDVHRGLPIMAEIARASGMEMKVFQRDKNPYIMNLYLKQGKYMSVPVLAFFNGEMKPLCHWIERPEAASKFMEQLATELTAKKIDEKEVRAEVRKRNQTMTDKWRQETVRELRELLSGVK